MDPSRDLSLAGRHALVCGASRGIGAATARALARLGATVTVLARDEEALRATVDTLPGKSGRHSLLVADTADTATLRTRVTRLVQTQPCQILINNSGGPRGGPAHSAGLDEYEHAFRQHLLAAHVLVQTLLDGMKAAGYGRIVNVISTSVKEPIRGLGVSNTIRGAVASWAKTLATELGPFGITVNNVLPGYTRTQRLPEVFAARARRSGRGVADEEEAALAEVPLGRFAEAAEIANAAAFLASPAASYVNGINLPVDGGRTGAL